MPAYEYACTNCGSFTAMRPMSERNDPKACPACGEPAHRIMLTAPAFAGMPAATRTAHAINERAAHEPKRSSHGSGCACCSGRRNTGDAQPAMAKTAKTFPGTRPWMISH